MATITACEPYRSPIRVIREGSASAAELMLTLSAPASKTTIASSRERMPPPTANGTNNCCAVLRTVSARVARIAAVTQLFELHTLYDASSVYVQAGYDSFGQHGRSQKFARSLNPNSPDF